MCAYFDAENVTPGWGCCSCRTYNGLQRQECKVCQKAPCRDIVVPDYVVVCDGCGLGLKKEMIYDENGAPRDLTILTGRDVTGKCPLCDLPWPIVVAS